MSTNFKRTRYVQDEPLGELQTFYEVDMHLLTCNACRKTWYESLPFLLHPMSRITKSFAKLMIRFRESMSITDVARNFGVDWRCVKDAEKEHLALKYRNNSLKDVTAITIDETYLFPHERPSRKYVTIVRDAVTGRVLGELRASNLQLADAHMLKEQLRKVYTFCETRYDAKSALKDWCQAARASGIFEMCQMANMVEKHLEGILGYWDFGHANSGSAEGFNTKVRLLMKQSYGLRDFKYLKLKIMDLPSRKIRVSI